jgi:hypothetical protein
MALAPFRPAIHGGYRFSHWFPPAAIRLKPKRKLVESGSVENESTPPDPRDKSRV